MNSVTDKRSGMTFSVGDTVTVFSKWVGTITAVSKKGTALIVGDWNGWTKASNLGMVTT